MPHAKRRRPGARTVGAWLVCATIVSLPAVGLAWEPVLRVERTDGFPGSHPLTFIRTITFTGDEMQVEEISARDFAYTLATVTRLYFVDGSVVTAAPDFAVRAPDTPRHLHPNRPNPVSSRTSIAFSLPSREQAVLGIYSVTGARIRLLADGIFGEGDHTVAWDGRDDSGRPVASGIYFYRLMAGSIQESRKLVYLR